MSTYILLLLATIWSWVVSPPVNWTLSLSPEWQIEIAITLLLIVFRRPLIEYFFICREMAVEQWKERRRIREWYFYANKDEREFRDLVEAVRHEASNEDRLAQRLERRAGQGFSGPVLRRAASRRQARAEALRYEADRLDRLWAAIEQERGGPGDKDGMRERVLRLMRELVSPREQDAARALDELRRIGAWFDWATLAPEEMTGRDRDRFVQVLRLMAGTTSVGEARNAYHHALRLLQQNNWDWQWEDV